MIKSETILEKALNEYKAKNFDDAFLHIDNVLEMNSRINDELVRNGMILINLDRFEEALTYLDKMLEINSEDSHILLSMGLVYELLGKGGESSVFYEKALRFEEDNFESLRNIGFHIMQLGGFQNAIPFLNEGRQLNQPL